MPWTGLLTCSDMLAARAKLGQHDVDALLVDRADARGRQAKLHPAVFAFDPQAAVLQVGQEAALGLVVRMRDVVAHARGLTGDLTHSSHRSLLQRARRA